MFRYRDFTRTENDDFQINITPLLDKHTWATPQYDSKEQLVGWYIKTAYE